MTGACRIWSVGPSPITLPPYHPITPSGCSRASSRVLRQDLSFREADKPFLVRSDLVDVDVVEPGLCVLVDLGEVLASIRADDDALGDLLRGDELDRLLEVGGSGQLLTEFAGEPGVRPDLVGGLERGGLVLVPADCHLSVAWAISAADGPAAAIITSTGSSGRV